MSGERFSLHREPVWRDRANFIINADLEEPGRVEQLWVRQLGPTQFEVCCIPFFLYDVALGDVVATAPSGSDEFRLKSVMRPSGRYVFRAYFEGQRHQFGPEVADALRRVGALMEWSSEQLVAIDIEGEQAQVVADILQAYAEAGRLVYETGKTAR